MKFVFVSKDADSLSIAIRVAQEGHSVVFMVESDNVRQARVGEGLVTLGPKPSLGAILGEKPDCVVFDMVGFGPLAGAVRGANIPVFGGSLWADLVELDRAYGTALMKACGIRTPRTWVFKSFKEAADFVRKRPGRYVFKPSGNLDTHTTYVSRGPEDMLGMLEHFQQGGEVPVGTEFELQEFVEGVEVSCEGWFNGTKFVDPFNITFEEKRFLEGGLGPNTGCMGNVVLALAGRPRIVREGIVRIEQVLRASDYRGPIDLNSIVTPDGLYGLEFTARFGYDAIQALLTGLRDEVGELLHGVATGKVDAMRVIHEFLIAVRLTVPPYPHSGDSKPVDVPVVGIRDTLEPYVWPSGIRREAARVVGCAPDGNLLVVTAWGASPREARKRVYRRVEAITIPDVQYRRDIGERVERDLGRLREWGWV